MPDIDLGDFQIDDDDPNLAIKDPNGNVIFEFVESAGEWQLGSALDALANDIANVGAFDATSATVSASPSAANDVAIKSYVDSVAQGLNWQEPVIDELNDPPASPNTGERYLIDDTPTGDWSGHPNEITEWDGSAWQFFAPEEGWAVFIEDIDLLKVFQSGDWVAFGSAIDHGNLAGLGDDDHTQYLLIDGTRAMAGALDMGGNDVDNVRDTGHSPVVSGTDYEIQKDGTDGAGIINFMTN